MHYAPRFLITVLLIFVGMGSGWTKPTGGKSEYKQTDAHFYLRGDVLKADPNATLLTEGSYTQTGDSYFVKSGKKPARIVYLQVRNDWLEPITPPDMPASLNIPADAMQIRETQGDVQVALPSAPASFAPATDGMNLPNGSVIKTGARGTAAVLFGGINSARLTPQTEAAVQQTVMPQMRTTEIDLHSGAVFSKVGLRPGEKQDFQVRTPMGVAAARGTDFVTVALPSRTDVWIAQGTVKLDAPDGKTVATASSEGTGTLKIIRNPPMTDRHEAMVADAETMSMAFNFIPMANLKVKGLRDRLASGGGRMTPSEAEYMHRMKKIPALLRLTLVEPPPAPSAPPPSPGSKPEKMTNTPQAPPVVQLEAPAPSAEAESKAKVGDSAEAVPPVIHSGKPEANTVEATEAAQPKTKPRLNLRDQDTASARKTKSSSSESTHHRVHNYAAPIDSGPEDTVP